MPQTETLDRGTAAEPEPKLRGFYCTNCGRRHCRYIPDTLGKDARILFRCRCKTESELRGADVWALLHDISHGKRGAD
jgi:hypothetical protein